MSVKRATRGRLITFLIALVVLLLGKVSAHKTASVCIGYIFGSDEQVNSWKLLDMGGPTLHDLLLRGTINYISLIL